MFSPSHPRFRYTRGFPVLWIVIALLAAIDAHAQVLIGQQVAVPSYFWPGSAAAPATDWTRMSATGPSASPPGLTGIAVANVNNGPDYRAFPDSGNSYSPNWGGVIANAHAAGIKVLGYVDSGYLGGSSPARQTRLRQTDLESWRSQIEHDINAWYAFYGGNIDGIFLDDGLNQCGPTGTASDTLWSDLYRNITNYVKTNHPGAVVAVNPGVAVPYCYEKSVDILLTFENSYACYTSTTPPPSGCGFQSPQAVGWPAYADPNKFWHLVYAADGTTVGNALTLGKQRGAGYMYVTSGDLPNPWGSLPWSSYWSLEQSDAAAVNAGTTPPTAPTILDTPVIGYTTATIEWSLSSGSNAVVAYDIYQSGVSTNGGRIWSVPQPDPSLGQTTAWVDLDGLLQPNTSYTFTVKARDAAGLLSNASNAVTFTTRPVDQAAPSAPGALQNTASTYTSATLSWQASTGPRTVVAYDVYQNGVKVLTTTESINDYPATSATLIGLAPGQSPGYSFTVVARDSEGHVSPASNAVTVSPPALPGGNAIANPGGSYTASTLTYNADFLVPMGFRRVFIKSGNAGNCYWTGVSPNQICVDYLIENSGDLLHYTGDATGTQWLWSELNPVVTPQLTAPTSSNTYRWQVPVSAFGAGTATTQTVIFEGDGFWPMAYSSAVTLTRN